MTLRLIVPADEDILPELIPTEMVQSERPRMRRNELEKSPGFQGSEFQAKQIGEMLALGLGAPQISKILKISEKVLQFYYAHEFETAEALVNAKVAKVALDFALNGRNPEMTAFWLKTRAGWSEKQKIELTGENGGPVEVAMVRQSLMKTVDAYENGVEDAEMVEEHE